MPVSDIVEEKCKHAHYDAKSDVFYAKVSGVNIQQMVIRVRIVCSDCKKPFIFKGATGFSTNEARVSQDGYELRAPIEFPDGDETEPSDEEKTWTTPILLH